MDACKGILLIHAADSKMLLRANKLSSERMRYRSFVQHHWTHVKSLSDPCSWQLDVQSQRIEFGVTKRRVFQKQLWMHVKRHCQTYAAGSKMLFRANVLSSEGMKRKPLVKHHWMHAKRLGQTHVADSKWSSTAAELSLGRFEYKCYMKQRSAHLKTHLLTHLTIKCISQQTG